jgi:hypothetical protein
MIMGGKERAADHSTMDRFPLRLGRQVAPPALVALRPVDADDRFSMKRDERRAGDERNLAATAPTNRCGPQPPPATDGHAATSFIT